MKKTTLALALLSTLSVASIAPAYAEDAAPSTDTTTAAPAPAPAADCKPGDKNCKPETNTTDGSTATPTDAPAPAPTDSGS